MWSMIIQGFIQTLIVDVTLTATNLVIARIEAQRRKPITLHFGGRRHRARRARVAHTRVRRPQNNDNRLIDDEYGAITYQTPPELTTAQRYRSLDLNLGVPDTDGSNSDEYDGGGRCSPDYGDDYPPDLLVDDEATVKGDSVTITPTNTTMVVYDVTEKSTVLNGTRKNHNMTMPFWSERVYDWFYPPAFELKMETKHSNALLVDMFDYVDPTSFDDMDKINAQYSAVDGLVAKARNRRSKRKLLAVRVAGEVQLKMGNRLTTDGAVGAANKLAVRNYARSVMTELGVTKPQQVDVIDDIIALCFVTSVRSIASEHIGVVANRTNRGTYGSGRWFFLDPRRYFQSTVGKEDI